MPLFLLPCPQFCLITLQSDCLSQSHLVRVAVLHLICTVLPFVFLHPTINFKTIPHPAWQNEQIPLPQKYFHPASCLNLKLSFKHTLMAVLIFLFPAGSFQLLTQGSADIVLDACSDFWDGSSLCPVTAFER